MESYSVKINSKFGKQFDVTARQYGFEINADGKNTAPLEALLAGLGACVGVYIRLYCERTSLAIGEFDVTVSGSLTTERPFRFAQIAVAVDLKGAELDDMRRNSLLSFVKNCPAHNTFKTSPEIAINII